MTRPPVLRPGDDAWVHVGAGDCERIRPGLVAQPANAASSLAYLAAGGALIARGVARPAGHRLPLVAFGALVAANGAGGVAFHGPGEPWARWIHDVALTGTLAFMAAHDVVVDAADGPAHLALAVAGAVAGGTALLLAFVPDASNPVTGTLAAGVVGAELLSARRGRFRRRRSAQGPYGLSGGALVVGSVVNLLSRTGRPLCRPDSRLQGHALWHALTALALAAWGEAALSGRPGGSEPYPPSIP